MNNKYLYITVAAGLVLCTCLILSAQDVSSTEVGNRLCVIWSSGDPDVAHRACFMYTYNAKKQGWFDEVTLVIWGPSARLLAGDKDLQEQIQTMKKAKIQVHACKACSDSYGVSEKLEAIGVQVEYMGKPLSEMLSDGWKTLTF